MNKIEENVSILTAVKRKFWTLEKINARKLKIKHEGCSTWKNTTSHFSGANKSTSTKTTNMYSAIAVRTAISDPIAAGFLMSSSHWKLNSEVRNFHSKTKL